MLRSYYIQKLLFAECLVLKKRETAQKTPQEEGQDVAQETSQEARKTRHGGQKQTVGFVKQDAAQDAAPHKDAVQEGTRRESQRMTQRNL